MRHLLIALALIGVVSTPALAVPFCDGAYSGLSFGLRIGGKFTDTEVNDFDLMALRRAGVDATRVERWNGCIRAYVRQPSGGEKMEFYEPGTMRRVY